MTSWRIGVSVVLGLLAHCIDLNTRCLTANDNRPNVLLIVADDQRPDTIRALGNDTIATPNLDRLVAQGTSFSRAYASYPICHVSRAQILTGCYAFRALPKYPLGPIDPSLSTLGQTLQAAGYQTWYSGKWHNDGQPRTRGYEGTRALYSSGGAGGGGAGGGGAGGTEQPLVDDRGRPLTGYRGWTFKLDGGQVELNKGVGLKPDNSRHIADGAIQAIRESKREGPFFLHVNFAFPHDPRQWPTGMRDYYRASQISLPLNFAPAHPFDHGNAGGRDELLLPVPRNADEVRQELAIYSAMITDMDAQLGRIVEALETIPSRDKDSESSSNAQNSRMSGRPTLIIFTSDQGLALGSHGLLGKQNQYEHSIRSPLIISGAGVRSGQRSRALVSLIDLFPTICEIAGIAIPTSVQGRSLKPILTGQADNVREYAFGAFTDSQRMICDSRWKLIVYPQVGREQLFDLNSDPFEIHDLSGDASHVSRRQELKDKLLAWMRSHGDPLKSL